MINSEDRRTFSQIYNSLADDVSRKIYKHRLLYSLFGEKEDIQEIVRKWSASKIDLGSGKICYYGAGAGGRFAVRYVRRVPFVIDKYQTGELDGIPVISLEEFLTLPDYRDYLVLITVGTETAQEEIKAELGKHEIKYAFVFFDCRDAAQYFEIQSLCPGMHNEYFADVGALDGNTTKHFLNHIGGHAYVLEPNPAQFAITKEALQAYPEAECFPFGAYDQNTTLYFDPVEGDEGSARVSAAGSIAVEVRRLDDLLGDRKVTFIKMDIEGSELAALRGAERIIREQRPKLAICVYHKPEDMWEIPSLILQYHPDYKLYLRHYSISETETVLYAV